MGTSNPMVFISYAQEDIDKAAKLAGDLRQKDINVWIATDSIRPGEQWQVAIKSAIKKSSNILLLMSKTSVSKAGYVQKEVLEALDRRDEFPESNNFLIPVRLEECEPSHSKISKYQWVDMFPKWDEGISRIVGAIKEDTAFTTEPAKILRSEILKIIPTLSVGEPNINDQDMQILKLIGDCLKENALGLFSNKIINEAKLIGIEDDDALDSIKILRDYLYLNTKDLGHNAYHIKGLSPYGFHIYASNFLDGYNTLNTLVSSHIVNSSDNDSDSISTALKIDVFIVNSVLQDLQASGRIKLLDVTTFGRTQYSYIVGYISPVLAREYKR